MPRALTTAKFIEKAALKHHNKYDYGRCNYTASHTKVEITCPVHGGFLQKPCNHLNGSGCPDCAPNKKLTRTIFIKKAQRVHGGKYNYDSVKYINSMTKVEIVCNTHGSFNMKPNDHLNGHGCPDCAVQRTALKKRKTPVDFIKEARKVHGDKYNYDNCNYQIAHSKVEITCPLHGSFLQKPNDHLNGVGCYDCGRIALKKAQRKSTGQFIKEATERHNSKYTYDKVNYVNSYTKVEITCPVHGSFWQRPNDHLGRSGCPECSGVGFQKSKPGLVYYFRDKQTGWYKIGITNYDVETRFKQNRDRIELLETWVFDEGEEAYELEQFLHDEYQEYRITNDSWGDEHNTNGRTEFFSRDVLNRDTN